jgi:hypothetical protein
VGQEDDPTESLQAGTDGRLPLLVDLRDDRRLPRLEMPHDVL